MLGTLQLLASNHGFSALVDRVSDAEVAVRFHATGAVLNMASFGGPRVCERLAQAGMDVATVTVVRRATAAFDTALSDVTQRGSIVHALELLALLARNAERSVGLLSKPAAVQDLARWTACEDLQLRESASQLLHTLLEGNVAASKALVGDNAGFRALESACAQAGCEDVSEALRSRAQLHALSALFYASSYAQDSAMLDPEKVHEQLVNFVARLLGTESDADPDAVFLAFEVLANTCASDDLVPEERVAVHSDRVAGSELRQRCMAVLASCKDNLGSAAALELAPRVCGLLDNLVQNTSPAGFVTLDAAAMWRGLVVLVVDMVKAGDSDEQVRDTLEELLCACTALNWSILRRLGGGKPQGKTGKATLVPQITVQDEELDGIVEALRSNVSPNIRANLVGIVGSLASQTQSPERLRALSAVAVSCIRDVSLVVVVQAVDTTIDIFADDAKHDLFVHLGALDALRQVRPRLRAGLDDPYVRADKEAMAEAFENLAAFLEYKQTT